MKFLALLLATTALASAGAIEDPIGYIRQELAAGKTSIAVPAGVYRIEPQGDVYLELRDLKGVTIDFTGVEFVGLVNARMFDIADCTDLTLKGLTMDFDPLAFTQARIVEVDAEKSWTVKIIEGYPTEGIGNGGSCWPIQAYGKDTLELVNPMRFQDGIDVVRIDEDTYRITGGQNRAGEVGDIAVFSCSNNPKGNRSSEAVLSKSCVNLRVEDFTIYGTPGGYAFKEFGNTRTVYLRCKIDRRPPETDPVQRGLKRLRSGNHDTFTCKCALVGPQIIGCTARYHGDDCVNISGFYSLVTESAGDEIRILARMYYGVFVDAGDTIQIMTPDGQCPPDATVVSITPDGERTAADKAFLDTLKLWPGIANGYNGAFRVKLDRNVSLPKGTAIMSNNQCGDGFLVKDCTFGHARARGLLIKASRGVIENNTIEDCWSSGIQVSTEYEWMSGGCSNDLKISGNRFSGNHSWAIGVSGKSGEGNPLPANSHRNIAIIGNTITDSRLGIKVEGCTGLEVRGNKVDVTATEAYYGLLLKNVADVAQEDNAVTTAAPPPDTGDRANKE